MLTQNALVDFYRACYHPNNSILVIVGDITPDEVKARLCSRLAQWPAGKVVLIVVADLPETGMK